MEKLRKFLDEFRLCDKGERSVFVIQLRAPDYWILLAGRERSAVTRFEVLFNGSWKSAVAYFSGQVRSNLKVEFVPFPAFEGETDFKAVCQDALRNALVTLPNALLTGDNSLSIFSAGFFVLKHSGILLEQSDFYFERWFDMPRKARTLRNRPFAVGSERKAFFCRLPTPVKSKLTALPFRARLERELEHDEHIFPDDGKLRTLIFDRAVNILLFSNGVVVADHRHREAALEALGALFAYAFFRGAPCVPPSIQTLGRVTITSDGGAGSHSSGTLPAHLRAWSTATVSALTLAKMFRAFARGIDSELLLDLRMLHQSIFHFRAGEYLQSFTLCWTALERKINRRWRNRIERKGYSGKRLEELCESDRYTVSVIVDMLDVENGLAQGQAGRIHSLRRSRNKAMHEGRQPGSEVARACLALVVELIREEWSEMELDIDSLLAG